MITEKMKRQHQMLTDPSLESAKLLQGKTGKAFIEFIKPSLVAMKDNLQGLIDTRAKPVSVTAKDRYLSKPYTDTIIELAVPQGMSVSYLEYITGMDLIKDNLDKAMQSVIRLNDGLDLILSSVDGEAGLSPVIGIEPKVISALISECNDTIKHIAGSRTETNTLPYADVVDSHSEWRKISYGVNLLREESHDIRTIENSMYRMDETSKQIILMIEDTKQLSNERASEIANALYSIASVYETYSLFLTMVTQLDVCVKANITAINK